ncbi:hypothetical protein J6590_056716 [Homalodisca vitripennis]|nr:hypothetical protein J6590_056716 [Homalodisca vitripennis]
MHVGTLQPWQVKLQKRHPSNIPCLLYRPRIASNGTSGRSNSRPTQPATATIVHSRLNVTRTSTSGPSGNFKLSFVT